MTLTAILPTLRASVPDPLDPAAWPTHTEPTVDDVRVAAVSMARLAEVVGTPCVHSAEQAPPRYRSRDWTPRGMSVAVVAVTAVHASVAGIVVELDAVLPECAVTSEARLIGRRTTAAPAPVVVIVAAVVSDRPDAAVRRLTLPRDVAVGDLVCLPCSNAVTHRTLVATPGAPSGTGDVPRVGVAAGRTALVAVSR